MKTEILTIIKKTIIRKGYGRTPVTYCRYIAENENHIHNLRTIEKTKLFNILQNNIISKHFDRYGKRVIIEGVYNNNKLINIQNPKVI